MPDTTQFPALFQRLKTIFHPYAPRLLLKADAQNYYPESSVIGQNGSPVFFGAVQIKKNYVSFHLMPVYVYPDLLKGISPRLQKRMQGKSCFNFTKPDEALFEELTGLVQKGYERYGEAGFLPIKE